MKLSKEKLLEPSSILLEGEHRVVPPSLIQRWAYNYITLLEQQLANRDRQLATQEILRQYATKEEPASNNSNDSDSSGALP